MATIGPGDVPNPRRRVMPGRRVVARHSVVEAETGDTMESIANLTRKDTPEYRDYLKAGSKRSGTVTARETGAKKMADELDLERITRARRLVNKMRREKAAQEKGRMT